MNKTIRFTLATLALIAGFVLGMFLFFDYPSFERIGFALLLGSLFAQIADYAPILFYAFREPW